MRLYLAGNRLSAVAVDVLGTAAVWTAGLGGRGQGPKQPFSGSNWEVVALAVPLVTPSSS